MTKTYLYVMETKNPDFSGFNYYVGTGEGFDVRSYASVMEAANNLTDDMWLLVEHETESAGA